MRITEGQLRQIIRQERARLNESYVMEETGSAPIDFGKSRRKIPLMFSDNDFGTEEFGFIPLMSGEDPDDADRRYEKHLRAQGIRGRVDRMGNVVVEGRHSSSAHQITESQLRRIIRQEMRTLASRRQA
jgi:hypothetical protein